MKDSVIFIDIDGPLLSKKQWWDSTNRKIRKENGDKWYLNDELRLDIKFDPIAIEYFKLWFEYSNAKAVISSNWRKWSTKERLVQLFKNNGLELDLHEDWQILQRGFSSLRCHDIHEWVVNHECDYLIVDDDDSITKLSDLENNYVLIDYDIGITSKNFLDGCDILEIDKAKLMEKEFGIKAMTPEEQKEYEKNLEMLINCMV